MTGKNKNKILIILVGVLILVCAAYIGMTKYVKDSEEKKESEAAAQSEAGRIWVTEMADVTGVALSNRDSGEDGVLSFIKKMISGIMKMMKTSRSIRSCWHLWRRRQAVLRRREPLQKVMILRITDLTHRLQKLW